jgi:DnaJ like chaperone protein
MKRWTTWLGGGLGWALGGPVGALLGAAVGNALSDFWSKDEKGARVPSSERDFHASLLVLASMVIKADGRVDDRELSFVREQFKQWFGVDRANEAFRFFKQVVQEQPALTTVCSEVRRHMSLQGRIQIVGFLFALAYADGELQPSERQIIAQIAQYLGLNQSDFDRQELLHRPSVVRRDPYEVLGLATNASDSDIKSAYRKLVKKYHPDALQGMGEDVVKEAEATFRQIQDAYEELCKARGIK